MWRLYLGWNVSDVAAALGVSNQAVAALTQRALKVLRAELGDDRVAPRERLVVSADEEGVMSADVEAPPER